MSDDLALYGFGFDSSIRSESQGSTSSNNSHHSVNFDYAELTNDNAFVPHSASPDPSLPDDWIRKRTDQGIYYYVNTKNGLTQWEQPGQSEWNSFAPYQPQLDNGSNNASSHSYGHSGGLGIGYSDLMHSDNDDDDDKDIDDEDDDDDDDEDQDDLENRSLLSSTKSSLSSKVIKVMNFKQQNFHSLQNQSLHSTSFPTKPSFVCYQDIDNEGNEASNDLYQFDNLGPYPFGPNCASLKHTDLKTLAVEHQQHELDSLPQKEQKFYNKVGRKCVMIGPQIFLNSLTLMIYGLAFSTIFPSSIRKGEDGILDQKWTGLFVSTCIITFTNTLLLFLGIFKFAIKHFKYNDQSRMGDWGRYMVHLFPFLIPKKIRGLPVQRLDHIGSDNGRPSLEKFANFTSQRSYLKNNTIYREATPCIELKFEMYMIDEEGVRVVEKTHQCTIPIAHYTDITPFQSPPPSNLSLIHVEYDLQYVLLPDQRDAIDYLKKKMVQKWGVKGEFFRISESFSLLSSTVSSQNIELPSECWVYTPENDKISRYCFGRTVFGSFLGGFFTFILGCYGPSYSLYKYTTSGAVKQPIVKAVEIGHVPVELQ